MTDHKFTDKMPDEAVIKALRDKTEAHCTVCDTKESVSCDQCIFHYMKHALDLINRQKAEIAMKNAEINAYSIAKKFDAEYFNSDIKKLEKENAELRMENHVLATEYADRVRTESIKEFAERLTNTIMGKLAASNNAPDGEFYYITDVYDDIDNLVKEMEEEQGNENISY